jgi:hypothetical protein
LSSAFGRGAVKLTTRCVSVSWLPTHAPLEATTDSAISALDPMQPLAQSHPGDPARRHSARDSSATAVSVRVGHDSPGRDQSDHDGSSVIGAGSTTTGADWFALSIQVAAPVGAAVAAIFAAVSARRLKEERDYEARVASARI